MRETENEMTTLTRRSVLRSSLGARCCRVPGSASSRQRRGDDYRGHNPAMAQIGAEHVVMSAAFAVMNSGAAPEQEIDKAFHRIEEIFAKYPIASS